MSAEPERLEEANLALWWLKATKTNCDFCSRIARYHVYDGTHDRYYCMSHTAKLLEFAANDIRHAVIHG